MLACASSKVVDNRCGIPLRTSASFMNDSQAALSSRISFAAHADLGFMLFQHHRIVLRSVLHAAIRVVNEAELAVFAHRAPFAMQPPPAWPPTFFPGFPTDHIAGRTRRAQQPGTRTRPAGVCK